MGQVGQQLEQQLELPGSSSRKLTCPHIWGLFHLLRILWGGGRGEVGFGQKFSYQARTQALL